MESVKTAQQRAANSRVVLIRSAIFGQNLTANDQFVFSIDALMEMK